MRLWFISVVIIGMSLPTPIALVFNVAASPHGLTDGCYAYVLYIGWAYPLSSLGDALRTIAKGRDTIVQHSSLQPFVYACYLHVNSVSSNTMVSVYLLLIDAVERKVLTLFDICGVRAWDRVMTHQL